jgi:hypothetical protein
LEQFVEEKTKELGNMPIGASHENSRAFRSLAKELLDKLAQVANPHESHDASEGEKRIKHNYVGAPAAFRLELACHHLKEAFCRKGGGIYQVGSTLQRPDWRDVDVRLMLPDDEFKELFPDAETHWEHDPRWLVINVAIALWLKDASGLNVDFQFQPQSHANARHNGRRNALGMIFSKG